MLNPDIRLRVASGGRAHADAVRLMFDRIAPTYDRLNRFLSFGVDTRWRRVALDTLLDGLLPGDIADVCSGTLDLTQMLKTKEATRTVIALDFSLPMLQAGKHKLRGQVQLAAADAMRLPLADASVAGVICGFGVRNVSEPAHAMAEFLRVLKPGGRAVVLEFFQPTRTITKVFHGMYGKFFLPTVGGIVSKDRTAYQYLSDSMQRFYSRDEFARMMQMTHYAHVRSFDLTMGIASVVVGEKLSV